MIYCRVDDFPGTKPEEFWKHNRENYLKFHEIVRRKFSNYVLGVIPKHCSDDDLFFLRHLDGVTLALHGIEHDERFPNEFRDYLSVDDISKKIDEASCRLHGSRGSFPLHYIPPHNVVDAKTIAALRINNYDVLHAGPGTDPLMFDYARSYGMVVRDSRDPREYGRTDEMMERGCFPHLNEEGKKRSVFLTLHWTWELNIGLDSLKRFCENIE